RRSRMTPPAPPASSNTGDPINSLARIAAPRQALDEVLREPVLQAGDLPHLVELDVQLDERLELPNRADRDPRRTSLLRARTKAGRDRRHRSADRSADP